MKLNGLIAVLIVAGCTAGGRPMQDPADLEYRAEDARIRAEEAFERLKARCAQTGRVAVVRRYTSGRLPPSTDELGLASC